MQVPDEHEEEPVREEYVQMSKEFEQLISLVTPMIKNHIEECGRPKTTPLTKWALPNDLLRELGPLTNEPSSIEECAKAIETTFKYSLKTMHPFFMDKLYAGSDPVGQIAEYVVAILNTNVHVYHVSPVFSVMEVECIRLFGDQFGFDPNTIDGSLNPGGSMSNMMALLAARHEHFPHVRQEGWRAEDRPVAFTALQSHYSINRCAMVCGMGMNQMIQIPSDRMTGAMDVEALDKAVQGEIEKGNTPFFVNSLAGSTVMGGFDDQEKISSICKKHGLWHHIDACWGGFLIFSDRCKRTIFKGCEKSDSIAFNPHKGLGTPVQTCILMTNNKDNALKKANTSGAEYLFHETEYSKYDIGDKTLSCGRRADSLALWLCTKRQGINGFKKLADAAYDKTMYITRLIKEQSDKFEMVNEPVGTNTCFWYTPPYFRKGAEGENKYTDQYKTNTHKLIFEKMKEEGKLLIQHNPLPEFNLPNFFRLTLKGEKSRMEDMPYLLDEIDRMGSNINSTILDNFKP